MIHKSNVIAGRVVGAAISVWAALIGTSELGAAEPEWKVGLAQGKITPEQPVFMAGYASRNKPFEKVETDLFVKALVLEDRQGQRAVVVTSDLIGFPASVAEPICARIGEKTGLKRQQILLNSAHVHTGPMVSLSASPRENQSAGDAQRTVAYTQQLQNKVVDVVVQAAAHLEPARLSLGVGVADFVMNRREFTPGGVILGVNPRGHVDRSVPVLRVDSPEGKLRAVLFGAACHNTTLTEKHYEICGDYAGFAQTYIQEHHPGITALFTIGCAGDANPYPRGTMDLARAHGASLGKEVCRVLETKLRPVRGPLTVAFDQASLPLQEPPSPAELEKQATSNRGIQSWVAKQMLAILKRGEKLPTHYPCPIAVWQFGGDLTLVGLSGEVVVDYVDMLEKALGPNHLWIAAYCNDVFGYLPSARVLSEGGYETRGLYSGGIGLFDAKAQDVLVEKVRELAKKVGRHLPGEGRNEKSIAPRQGVIKLFNGQDRTGLYTWLKGSGREDPKKVFTIHDGMIHASGEDLGYVATDKEYQDYHLIVEYKWGQKTYGSKSVRNSGILLHAVGPDGGAGGVWMSCIECQLAQGCVGDLIVIRGKDKDGSVIPVALTSETVLGPDKRPRWQPGGQERVFTKGQLWWSQHDPDYQELIDTRGKHDVESPLGEWTRIDCLCDAGRITVLVNGTTVNKCYNVYPAAGKVLLQSEGFEIFFRRFELRPLKRGESKPEK